MPRRTKPKERKIDIKALTKETAAISESEQLMVPVDIQNRPDQLRMLAHTFIKNRLENSTTSEGVKRAALDKLLTILPTIESPSTILRVIESLNKQTERDMLILAGVDPTAGDAQGSQINIFNGGGDALGKPAIPIGGALTKDHLKLLDIILQTVESVVKDKGEADEPIDVTPEKTNGA